MRGAGRCSIRGGRLSSRVSHFSDGAQAHIAPAPELRGQIGALKFFSLGFGSILGSAWVLLLGGWLLSAGVGGTIVGLVAGAGAMALLGLCYAELCARVPQAGGELVYALYGFGPRTAFAVSWLLMLYLVGVTVFEAIAFGAMVRRAAPWIAGPTLYHLFGAAVTLDGVLLGCAGAISIFWLNLRGGTISSGVQGWLTYGFIAVVVACLLYMSVYTQPSNFSPFWQTPQGGPWIPGALTVFTTSCFLLTGFQAISQAVEERASIVSLKSIAVILVLAIVAAAMIYVGVVLCASGAAPWRDLANSDVAIVDAALRLPFGKLLAGVLLGATCVSILKTWNGVAFTAGRLIMAQARHGFLPAGLARLNTARTTPVFAFLVLGSINLVGVFFGRGALLPIVATSALGICFISVICCIALIRLRWRAAPSPFEVPGGIATIVATAVIMGVMGLVAFLQPLTSRPGFPLEWTLLISWSALGAFVWFARASAWWASCL
jgi:APA family basic amino acid/polyamine antiporter